MKKMYLVFNVFLLAGLLLLASCFSSQQTMKLNSIELTNQLHPGMSYAEVESLLGKPKSSRTTGNKYIVRWNLQEMWKGYIPYDMVFNASNKTLISWAENSKAFDQQQAQLAVVASAMQDVESSQGGGGPSANFQNNPELMKYFQGAYYHFSSSAVGTGGTEKEISLCPNGRYFSSSESGYSGGAGTSGGWGTASQGGGGGTWKITGTKTSGTIAMTDNSGKTTTYEYSVCGDGCIYFGDTKFGYNGDPKCN
jgi:hypothetical protein